MENVNIPELDNLYKKIVFDLTQIFKEPVTREQFAKIITTTHKYHLYYESTLARTFETYRDFKDLDLRNYQIKTE